MQNIGNIGNIEEQLIPKEFQPVETIANQLIPKNYESPGTVQGAEAKSTHFEFST